MSIFLNNKHSITYYAVSASEVIALTLIDYKYQFLSQSKLIQTLLLSGAYSGYQLIQNLVLNEHHDSHSQIASTSKYNRMNKNRDLPSSINPPLSKFNQPNVSYHNWIEHE